MSTDFTNIDAFNPRVYLEEYYPGTPDPEDEFVVEFMVKALQQMPSDLLILDFGGGPTLFAEVVLAKQAREIHFCDYIPASLDEIRLWLNDDVNAFDWTPYIKMGLEKEGVTPTPERIAQRANRMRQTITRLTTCDGLAENPLGACQDCSYDLVVAQSSTDVAATSVAQWQQIIQNITTLVAPGGWLLISVITGTQNYSVGNDNFHCVDLTEDDIYQGYLLAGYDPNSFVLDKLTFSTQHAYSGVANAVARKLQ